jgi:hypothetical protein
VGKFLEITCIGINEQLQTGGIDDPGYRLKALDGLADGFTGF